MGNYLKRTFDRQHLIIHNKDLIFDGGKSLIKRSVKVIPSVSAIEAIRVRDAAKDQNRYTGSVPGFAGAPPIQLPRGGLYFSEDNGALAAENRHYANKALLHQLALSKCFALVTLVRDVDLVNVDFKSAQTLSFFDRLQKDNAVYRSLKELGYKDLIAAVLHEGDYSAARGLGLGLASNPRIDGVRVPSAREYSTRKGHNLVTETGDNIVLFHKNQEVASDKVRVVSLHLVDVDRTKGGLTVTHFQRARDGSFPAAGSESA
jgi:hypothetical protein